MHEHDVRRLQGGAVVLLAASALRAVLGTPEARDPLAGAPDVLGALSAATDSATLEEEVRSRPLEPGERLDPNRATASDLDRLPGIGPALATRWVEEREAGGAFSTPQDLTRIRGVGAVLVDRLAAHLAFPPGGGYPPPGTRPSSASRGALDGAPAIRGPPDAPATGLVDLNRANATDLESLPGIGPALALRILAFRAGRAGVLTVDDLAEVRGIGPATVERIRPYVRGKK